MLRAYWRNTKDMPSLMGTLCQGGMVAGPILFIFVVLPIADWTVNGREMTYSEFWGSGAGIWAVLFVGLVTGGMWGMAARKPSSRWALVLAPVLPVAFTLPFSEWRAMVPLEPIFALELLVIVALLYVCLFHIPSVQRYFADGQTSA